MKRLRRLLVFLFIFIFFTNSLPIFTQAASRYDVSIGDTLKINKVIYGNKYDRSEKITKISLAVWGWDTGDGLGIYATKDYSSNPKTSINLKDISTFTIDTEEEPFDEPGSYEVRVWVKTTKNQNPTTYRERFTVNVLDGPELEDWDIYYTNNGYISITAEFSTDLNRTPYAEISDPYSSSEYTLNLKSSGRGEYGSTVNLIDHDWTLYPEVNYTVTLYYGDDEERDKKINFDYLYYYSNGLRVIQTKGSNLIPSICKNNVPDTGCYGINGGFFVNVQSESAIQNPAITTISIINDSPLFPKASFDGVNIIYTDDYISKGSGWFNWPGLYSQGTVVFDGDYNSFTLQHVFSGDDISVSDRSNYWAIGGFSMSLQDDADWYTTATDEGIYNPNSPCPRTGLVFDGMGYTYLINSATWQSSSEFRTNIKFYSDQYELFIDDGIFLDGSGSTQMNCEFYSEDGNRSVPVMLMLKNKSAR